MSLCFVLGVAIFWMAALTLVMCSEKISPFGATLVLLLTLSLILWVVADMVVWIAG